MEGECIDAANQASLAFYELKDVCKPARSDALRVEKWLSLFTTHDGQSQIQINIAMNMDQFTLDFIDAEVSIAADDYNKAGVIYADMFIIALGPIAPTPASEREEWGIASAWMFPY